MAIKVSSVKCPNCGANVSYDGSSKTGKCEFCGTLLDFTEEYGPKNDRMRDDIQDMQIRDIMNNMYRNNNANRASSVEERVQSARKIAKIIAIVFVVISLLLQVTF